MPVLTKQDRTERKWKMALALQRFLLFGLSAFPYLSLSLPSRYSRKGLCSWLQKGLAANENEQDKS